MQLNLNYYVLYYLIQVSCDIRKVLPGFWLGESILIKNYEIVTMDRNYHILSSLNCWSKYKINQKSARSFDIQFYPLLYSNGPKLPVSAGNNWWSICLVVLKFKLGCFTLYEFWGGKINQSKTYLAKNVCWTWISMK